jgi:sphingolipid delta-4 desaturase
MTRFSRADGNPSELALQETDGFLEVNFPEPHRSRCLDILKRHPEVRALFGRNPWTAAYIAAVVILQIALAYLLRAAPWWLILAAGWTVGAVVSHTGFCLYHECSHHLVFRRKSWNHLLGIFANLPLVLPSYASFCVYHLKHHQYQGDYNLDADMATRWEARLIGHSAVGKAAWQLLFPLFQCLRTRRFARAHRIRFWNGWVVLNLAVQLAFLAALLWLGGPRAFAYLVASFFFSVGLHPLGARWIQEHFVVRGDQETYSYYGPMNRIAANIGYHNEHHDFPFVPWNRLPKVRRIAPEIYDALESHSSWFKVWLRFLSDPRLSLYARVARDAVSNRARAPMPKETYAPATFDETPEGAAG